MPTTFTVRTSANASDIQESLGGGNWFYSEGLSYIGKSDSYWTREAGFRFTNVTVAQGATITSAKLTFKAGNNFNRTIALKIKGIDVDNCSEFSSGDTPRSRAMTTSQIDWDQTVNVSVGNSFDSPDITSVIQEIVNRAGWSSGNSIGIYIADDGSSNSNYLEVDEYEDGASSGALLTINYGTTSASPSASTSLSPSASVSPSSSRSPSPSSSISPSPQIQDFGIKISKDGFDVKKSTIYQDVFTSKKGVLGKRKTGTFTVATSDGYANDSTSTGLDYIPIVFVTVTCRDGTVINVPGSYESTWSDTEVLDESYTYYLGDGTISFYVHSYHYEPVQGGSSTELDGQEYTFNILYCFNELSIEE